MNAHTWCSTVANRIWIQCGGYICTWHGLESKSNTKKEYWQYLLCWHALLLSIIILHSIVWSTRDRGRKREEQHRNLNTYWKYTFVLQNRKINWVKGDHSAPKWMKMFSQFRRYGPKIRAKEQITNENVKKTRKYCLLEHERQNKSER